MEARHHGLIVRSEGRNLEVSNGLLLVRFVYRDGGYAQEFHAANAKGEYRLVLSSIHKDIIPSSEHRVSDSPMISGSRPHLFSVCRESLRMIFSEVQLHRPDSKSVVLRLSGSMQANSVMMRITVEQDSNVVHCEVENALAGPRPVIEYLMSSYAFLPGGRTFAAGEEPEFTWAPNLRPTNDAVIGDLAFFSPAAIVQHGRYAAALMPDVGMLSKNRPMPASLDLDLNNGLLFAPLLSYGFCDYEPAAGGSYFRHDISLSRRLDANRLVYGYDLIVDADCKRESSGKQVARFLWQRYGSDKVDKHAKPGTDAHRSAVSPDATAAYGLWAEGIATKNDALVAEARAMRDAVLQAPVRHGLFATRFDRSVGFWRGCSFPDGPERYSTAECSEQMYWLLRLHEDFEPTAATLRRARDYADFLIENRMRSGAIPTWYDMELIPEAALRSSAPTAVSALFLARLARTTGLKKHLQACAAALRFVLREVIPHGLFLDHTCVSPDGAVSLECADPHTGLHPQSSRAMLWCAELCIEAYALFGDKAYLNSGLDVLDRLCLMQSVHEKSWMPGSAGMLARGNMCAHADPALTADFAYCAMQYGAAAGVAEYCDRGAAALRAAMNSDCSASERARVDAVASVIDREFGAIYVSVAGKWCVELNGCRIDGLDIKGATISLSMTQGAGNARVVFAGLRARSYDVSINGHKSSHAREEMEAGLAISL